MQNLLMSLALAIVLTLGLLTQSEAGEFKSTQQMIVTALIAADWAQTRNIARRDDLFETNRFLGRNPSINDVNQYFLAYALGYNLAAYYLPNQWAKRLSIMVGIGQTLTVHKNLTIGVKFDF